MSSSRSEMNDMFVNVRCWLLCRCRHSSPLEHSRRSNLSLLGIEDEEIEEMKSQTEDFEKHGFFFLVDSMRRYALSRRKLSQAEAE